MQYIDTSLDEVETTLNLIHEENIAGIQEVEKEFHFIIEAAPPSPPLFPNYSVLMSRIADLFVYQNTGLSEDRKLLEKNPRLRELFHYEPESGKISLFDLTNRFKETKFKVSKKLPSGASSL